MPKNIHTPRDELVCGKIDKLEAILIANQLIDAIYLLADIRHDCQRMEAKLISRKDDAHKIMLMGGGNTNYDLSA